MLPITASNPFKWRHYQGDIILWCVRWYLRYPISLAHMAEMAAERGLSVTASCIWRWVQAYGPEIDKRCCRAALKSRISTRKVTLLHLTRGRRRVIARSPLA
jgi:transposase-like protein